MTDIRGEAVPSEALGARHILRADAHTAVDRDPGVLRRKAGVDPPLARKLLGTHKPHHLVAEEQLSCFVVGVGTTTGLLVASVSPWLPTIRTIRGLGFG